MITIIVSLKDTAAQAFGRPIFVPTAAVAVRSVRDEVNRFDSTDDLAKHSDDFELYELGEFDDSNGEMNIHPIPVLLVRCKDLKDA